MPIGAFGPRRWALQYWATFMPISIVAQVSRRNAALPQRWLRSFLALPESDFDKSANEPTGVASYRSILGCKGHGSYWPCSSFSLVKACARNANQ